MRSRGGPWRPTRASPCPSTGRFEPCPSRWRAAAPPTPPLFRGVGLAWPHPVGAPLRLSVRLSPLAVCCLPGPRPGVSRFRARRGPDPLPVSPPPVRRRRRSSAPSGRSCAWRAAWGQGGPREGEGAGRGGRALGSPRWWLQVALGTGQVPGRMGAQGHGWAAHRPAGGSEDRGPQRAPKPESSGATWP